jgi:transcriptional regulator with XRE-family HTH domain
MSQADLAAALGISEPRVSQMFGAKATNLTIRTIARIFHVLGDRCEITSARVQEMKGAAARDWRPLSKTGIREQRPAIHGSAKLAPSGMRRREAEDEQWVLVGLRPIDSKFINDNGLAPCKGEREPKAA